MSINIGDNLSYLGAKPLDGRLKYDTVSEMAGMADNVLYEGCLAYCVGTGKTYQWKSSNTVDPTTGKWREFTSGGGTAEDPIEYVSELPTSGIEDKIYGIKVTSGITKTIQIIKPIPGQLSKEEATAYFSQFFTVTEESNTRLSLSVYPDLVLSRDGWTDDYKAADGDIVTLAYLVDSQELSWTNSSSQETSTAAWSLSPIRCTSAYFPTYKYYAGVETTQELNEIGAGGSGDVDIDNDTIIENQQGELSVSPAFKKIFLGTEAEWNALTTAEKIQWDEAHIPDATESADNLWYFQISDIDPNWQTNLTSMGKLANKFPYRKSVYLNFSASEGRTAASIGLLPKTIQDGGILHFVTGADTSFGRAYAIFVPDHATNKPYFCEASNWKSNSSWVWKYGDDIYSTEEIITDKIWIDGRPIYRRVLTFSASAEVGTSETSISNKLVERPADILSWGIADVVFIQKTGNFSEGVGLTLNVSTGVVNAVSLRNSSYTFNAGYHIMIEYTKTTD